MRNKLKSDKGNSIILLGLLLLGATLVVGAILLDISKAYQLKSAYVDAAEKAAQTAIRYQSPKGYLEPEAIAEAARVYEQVTRPSVISDGAFSSCSNLMPGVNNRNVEIKIKAMKDEFTVGQVYTIDSNRIRSTDSVDNILSKLSPSLSKNSRTFENGKYTGIEMDIVETTPNVILPAASAIRGEKDDTHIQNLKCQELGIRAGASQYIGTDGNKND